MSDYKQLTKADWVNALRSRKYKQGEGSLLFVSQGKPRYCCLGVVCDVADLEKIYYDEGYDEDSGIYDDGVEFVSPDGRSCNSDAINAEEIIALIPEFKDVVFPIDVSRFPTSPSSGGYLYNMDEVVNFLIYLNDTMKYKFGQIAGWIERNL